MQLGTVFFPQMAKALQKSFITKYSALKQDRQEIQEVSFCGQTIPGLGLFLRNKFINQNQKTKQNNKQPFLMALVLFCLAWH